MRFEYDDGGRGVSGLKGAANDCVPRAIAIATGRPYLEVYRALHQIARKYVSVDRSNRLTRALRKRGMSPRNGTFKDISRTYLSWLGWKWVPTMFVGKGCRVHLREEELPRGSLIVSVSKHAVAVVDGVIRDTSDPSRGGNRCVYGYWIQP